VKALLKTCFSGLKSSRWVGDFQVATGGGFWVATRAFKITECNRESASAYVRHVVVNFNRPS
jgi:hypothetical protein